MPTRSETLQQFVDAISAAYEEFATDSESRRSIGQIFAKLREPASARSGSGSRLPVCSHLNEAWAEGAERPLLGRVVATFKDVEPHLEWRRSSGGDTASSNFAESHANAMILGPGGLEDRQDVWLGVTIMAPNVRYPDHTHPPEEVYLVLSRSEFRQDDGAWFTPGLGGAFYNRPGIKHAMRSTDTPLFAFWALQPQARA